MEDISAVFCNICSIKLVLKSGTSMLMLFIYPPTIQQLAVFLSATLFRVNRISLVFVATSQRRETALAGAEADSRSSSNSNSIEEMAASGHKKSTICSFVIVRLFHTNQMQVKQFSCSSL